MHLLFEGGAKLGAQSQTIATGAVFYHRFFEQCNVEDYDPHLIAATSMYLAGKVEEDHLKIRDVVNVFHKVVHPNSDPLDLGEEYWSLRDAIVQGELLLLRMLQFKVSIDHPHKYMLHYLKSLNDWMDPKVLERIPLMRMCWSLLCDLYHGPICLEYKPQHVAIAIINISLQCYALTVPFSEEAVLSWYETLCEDVSREKMWEVMEGVISVYDGEEDN